MQATELVGCHICGLRSGRRTAGQEILPRSVHVMLMTVRAQARQCVCGVADQCLSERVLAASFHDR
eukprot:1160518-Pelagomonas_calceolata.AAC.2